MVQVSSNFFPVLGTQPVLGRGFTSGDDVDGTGWGSPGRNAVAVIGYGLWQALFGGDPKALGATVRVDGTPLTIVGIAPAGFDYPGKVALWKPAAFSRGNNGWEVVGRLKPGVTRAQARQAFAAEADRLWPDRTPVQKAQSPSRITELRDQLAGPTKSASLVLLASVALILLIACTNVANLLLARTADRAAELSIRSALGASRARLTQQLLTESVLLALAASIAGVFVAFWTTSIAAKVQPAPIASQAYSVLDGRVLGFAIGISVLSGLLFGALPSLFAGRVHTFEARGSSNSRASRLVREGLVAAQVMLAVVLLTSSLSVGSAFLQLMRINRGFVPSGLVTVNISLQGTTHEGGGRSLAYFEEALARVRRLPGVQSASATEFLPMYSTGGIGGVFAVDGRPGKVGAGVVPVFSDYFRTMGGRIVAGREFTAAEVRGNAKVAMVNERFAAQFGAPADALGHQIFREPRKIIGVVQGMDYRNAKNDPTDANPRHVFIPSTTPGGFFSTLVARVDGRAEDRLAMVRDAVQSVDPQVPVFGVKTMEQRLDEALARPQFYRTAVSSFAAFALLLAMIGIYGVVSYTVARRTHEMGVRMALGTTPAGLRVSLLRQGLLTIGVGAVLGIAGAVLERPVPGEFGGGREAGGRNDLRGHCYVNRVDCRGRHLGGHAARSPAWTSWRFCERNSVSRPKSNLGSGADRRVLAVAYHECVRDHDTGIGGPGGVFPSTQVSLIAAAGSGLAADALERVVAVYWKPVYRFIRLKFGRDNEDAKDLTQSFFANALERDFLARFDPTKASFRTYIRMAVERFASNQHAAAQRQKRGGDVEFEPVEDQAVSTESPEDVFEREWRRQLFALALDDLRAHCEASGKQLPYRIFEAYDLAEEARPSYADLARQFEIAETSVTNHLAWARRMLRGLVTDRLSGVTSSEPELRKEMRRVWS